MDPRKLTEILKATIDPEPVNRKQAEEQLNQVHIYRRKKIGDMCFFLCHKMMYGLCTYLAKNIPKNFCAFASKPYISLSLCGAAHAKCDFRMKKK